MITLAPVPGRGIEHAGCMGEFSLANPLPIPPICSSCMAQRNHFDNKFIKGSRSFPFYNADAFIDAYQPGSGAR